MLARIEARRSRWSRVGLRPRRAVGEARSLEIYCEGWHGWKFADLDAAAAARRPAFAAPATTCHDTEPTAALEVREVHAGRLGAQLRDAATKLCGCLCCPSGNPHSTISVSQEPDGAVWEVVGAGLIGWGPERGGCTGAAGHRRQLPATAAARSEFFCACAARRQPGFRAGLRRGLGLGTAGGGRRMSAPVAAELGFRIASAPCAHRPVGTAVLPPLDVAVALLLQEWRPFRSGARAHLGGSRGPGDAGTA
mmetsp:Transcript_100539/g.322661  ORF Transcript_100539/g.322661 Transcript_100539/m.322661 type:complete len:251 (-) Transcript_100539:603-1355(-)